MSGKVKLLEESIEKQQIKVDSHYRRAEWKRKVGTLCEEYEKNVEILQKEYLKAMVNLTSTELGESKDALRTLLGNSDNYTF